MRPITAALFCAVFLLISHLQGNLQAYLDPGSGSLVLQFILGGTVAALVAFRAYWERVKTFLFRTSSDHDAAPGAR
jgi:hypothetical protein